MFFNSWADLGRILIVGVATYLGLVALLRAAGKRMLSKMNAFDLIVTVALGSTLATVITSKQVALAEGATALALLVGLQYVLAWAAARSPRFGRIIKSEPTLVFFRGGFLKDAMLRENVSEAGIRAQIRQRGLAQLDDVEAVVLESDGSMNVIARNSGPASVLAELDNYPPR